jgi:hypothetical protein
MTQENTENCRKHSQICFGRIKRPSFHSSRPSHLPERAFMVKKWSGSVLEAVADASGDIAKEHSMRFYAGAAGLSTVAARRTWSDLDSRALSLSQSLLRDDDITTLLSVIANPAQELNCVTTQEAKKRVTDLRRVRLFRAEQVLIADGCPNLERRTPIPEGFDLIFLVEPSVSKH